MNTETYESPNIINDVGELLRHPLPRAREDMETHIIELDGMRFELARATVDSLQLLYQKRKQTLWPKDTEKNLTELDRTTRLNGDVAVLEREYQFLVRVEALVEARLNLALTLLT